MPQFSLISLRAAALLLAAVALGGCASQRHSWPSISSATVADMANAPAELARANEAGRVEIFTISDRGGETATDRGQKRSEQKIVVRAFGTNGLKKPVIMAHGLESHSAWFAQSASFISNLGHPVYIIDRRGSGLSQARRGHSNNFNDWSSEMNSAARQVMARHRAAKVHVVGHCFGAIPASIFVVEHPDIVQSLILPTPAIVTTTDLSVRQKCHVVCDHFARLSCYLPVLLKPEQFTDSAEYQAFIQQDELKLSAVSTAFYWNLNRARSFLSGREDDLRCPIWLGLAGRDEIIDGGATRERFRDFGSDQKRLVVFPAAKHILEFSPEREAFFQELESWFQSCDD